MKAPLALLYLSLLAFVPLKALAADSTPPSIQSASPPAGATIGTLTQITVTFSEPVTNISASDLFVNGISAVALSGGPVAYTFTLEIQPNYGPVQITWDPSHEITDLATPPNRFNENAPGSTWQYTLVDSTAPYVSDLTPAQGVTVRSLTQIDVFFSEGVSGVEAGDLSINGLPAANLAVLGLGKYRFTFPQPPPGTVQLNWASNTGIHDLAPAPNNFAGGSWTYTLDPNFGLPSIRINEFLGGNLSGLADEDAEKQDWIEIWNYGTGPVNLAGFSLSDDIEDPGKWTFPATNIGPGQFLVVFASGKDRRSPSNASLRFHTNFKLSAGGGYLGLFNAESPRAAITEFAPNFPEQRNDYSYGYDGAGNLKYFVAPTPGAANGSSLISGILAPPHFNVERGYFSTPFTLILNDSGADATIRYTTDGSEPSLVNGSNYTASLNISNLTILRAAAFKTNMLPSLTVTHTYFFLDQVLRQPNNPPGFPVGATNFGGYPTDYEMDPEIVTNQVYAPQMLAALKAMPSVSLVTSVDAMFGATNGIYTHIAESTTLFRGSLWERACSVEFIPTNGTGGFQVNCGVRMQGNASRNPQKTPKHPFRLVFKTDYGPGHLDYEVYPNSPVQSFNTLVMRADFNNSMLHWDPNQRIRWTRIRDAWVKDTWRAMDQPGSHSRYFHLYINGLYWGVYDFGERVDATLAANYLGGQPEEYDAIASKPTQAIDGDITAYNTMTAAVRNQDQSVLANYTAVTQLLDINNFIDYMMLNFYGANQDWGNDSNWNAVRRRTPDGKFKYIAWDGEQLLVSTSDNRVSNTDVPGGLHTSLVNSPEYRLNFADRAQKHLFNGGVLTTNAGMQRWLTRAAQVDPAIIADSARWGDYRRDVHQYQNPPYYLYTRDTNWLVEINRVLTNYFPQRHEIFLSQLRAAGLYPAISAPGFNQQGGFVLRGFNLTMSATNAIYYTLDGTDPRVYGTGAISPGARLYSGAVVLTNSAVVKARALSGSTWSALNETLFTVDALGAPLRITEIMYNPPGGDAYEYLELQNVGVAPLNVGGYSIDGVSFVFAPNTILAPGQVIVLGSDTSPGNWAIRYPGVTAFGRFGGKLDNGGEKLAIRNAAGQIIWSVDYDDEKGWPAAADGPGYSLEIVDVFGDPDDPANWRASAGLNGSPGTIPPPPAPGAIVLNELMADNVSAVNNGGFYSDWVELRNTGADPVNLANWSLSNDSNPRKFVFGTNDIIQPGGYLVVWCSTNVLVPGLRAGFGLGRNGDSLILFDAGTNRVDAIGFGLQLPNYSIGRIAGAWQLTSPTPNAANSAVTLGSSTNLAINEWLAKPPPGGADWVELYNRSATQPVSLKGIYLGTSNTTYQLAALSFIAPGGYVQLFADENPGADHLDFKLPEEGGAIILYDPVGFERERITYGQQAQNVTQGRLPDGAPFITAFPASPSPGASNYLIAYNGPILSEVLAVNHAAVTNAAGRTADFVELWNTNGAPFDLSGMRLGNDPGPSGQWTFPAGSILPANSFLVVWCDNEYPASTVAASFLNTGFSLNGESGEVWLFNTGGQPVDSVVFGFQIADLPIGRTGPSWNLLASATPGTVNAPAIAMGSPAGLRLNEWMANSSSGDDWFEIYNSGSQPVALNGVFVADSPAATALTESALPPLSFIAGKGFVKCVADGHPSDGRNHVNFGLEGEGEALRLYSQALGIIDTVYFGAQQTGVSQGRLPDGAANIVSFPTTPTPAESNYLPLPNAVMNEILSHTDPPLEDALELYNPTRTPVDISGWFLSDSQLDFKKFQIPPGTSLPGYGFKVVYENQLNGGTGSLVPFTFDSSRGDEAWLSAADSAGNLTGYRAGVKFGPAANGVSFGRYETTLGVDFTAQSQRTFGADNPASLAEFRTGGGRSNAPPRVGPVVINEIMYHPPDIGGTNDNVADEFIELYNLTTNSISLFDPSATTNTWRFRGSVSFNFPTGVTLASRGFLLVASFDPAANPAALSAFRSQYGLPATVAIYGPYTGKLANSGDSLQLFKPDPPQGPGPDQGFVPYVLADRVDYTDSFPWPLEADGGGTSLQRRRPGDYGNDPVNWRADSATAGRPNVPGSSYIDADGDGISDVWEAAHGLSASNGADADQDPDGDGHTSLEEFLAGTDPQSASSRLDAPVFTLQPTNTVVLPGENATFIAAASGSAPVAYQWRRNGIAISGATSSQYTLPNVQPGDSGEFTLLVINQAGFALSQAASLIVKFPPIITSQPQSVTVSNGLNATFTVGATGTGLLRYQWFFNGQTLATATNVSLSLTNVQIPDMGAYSVTITDDITSVASQPANLIVMMRPSILINPTNQLVAAGSTITLSCVATGTPPLYFRWRRNNATYTNLVSTSGVSLLVLTNLQTTAFYNVVVSNIANLTGVLSSSATVTVVNPPAITLPPTNRSVALGGSTLFSVTATGSPPLYYQWTFNGGPLGAASTNNFLSLTNVQFTNEGNYAVTVTNLIASTNSPAAFLEVLFNTILSGAQLLPDGTFRMQLTGKPNRTYAIETSAGLTNWTQLTTIPYTNGTMPFADSTATNATKRFYRARLTP